MAIKLNIELENGIKVDRAYLRVEYPAVTKDTLTFTVRKYVDAEKPFFSEQTYIVDYSLDGENPFKQAYEYLKTLEEFKGSEDC